MKSVYCQKSHNNLTNVKVLTVDKPNAQFSSGSSTCVQMDAPLCFGLLPRGLLGMRLSICVDPSCLTHAGERHSQPDKELSRQKQRMNTTFRSSFICIPNIHFMMYPKPHESLQAEHCTYHYANKVLCILCSLSLIYRDVNSCFLFSLLYARRL